MEDIPHLAEPPLAPSALSRLACGAGGARAAAEGTDAHWAPECLPAVPPHSSTLWADGAVARADYSSRYLTMRDGTRIAVDVLLPCGAGAGGGAPFNAVFVQSRYGRAWRLRWPYRRLWGGKPVDLVYFLFKSAWLAAGLAVVTMDMRGCGASFGTWRRPWSEEEAADSAEVLDWVVAQPWSSGKVALFGQSYDAVAALHTVALAHPAVAACCAVNPFLDMFTDVSAPGGVPQRQFVEHWAGLIDAFDNQILTKAPGQGLALKALMRGVARALPVEELEPAADGDVASAAAGATGRSRSERAAARARRRALLAAAVAQHGGNWDPCADAGAMRFVDDVAPSAGVSPEAASAGATLPRLAASNVPIYWTSAWFDATAASAAAGFAATSATPGTELLVGPWTHMLWQQVCTGGAGEARLSAFDLPRDTLRFMLARLAGAPPVELPVRTFEMGATGRWVQRQHWPPRGQRGAVYALQRRSLAPLPGAAAAAAAATSALEGGRDEFTVHTGAHPTGWSRWQAMLNVGRFVRYDLGRLPLRYVGPALGAPLRVAGAAVVTVYLDSSDRKGDLFAYLIDVDTAGEAHYVSEGCFRALHRAEPPAEEEAAALGPARCATAFPQHAPRLPRHTFRAAAAAPLPPRPAPGGAAAPHAPPARVAFPLMATEYVFAKGHRVALALSGADAKHFAPEEGGDDVAGARAAARVLGVSWGPQAPSTLALPVVSD